MKYFLFDIGRVLVDFDGQDFLDAVSAGSGVVCAPLAGRDLEMHDAVETGHISDAQWVDHLNSSMGTTWAVDDLTDVWTRIFKSNGDGRKLFEEAKDAGLPVYLLSNIAKHHVDAIERNWPGIFDGVSGCFFSYRIGVRKPHPDIYRHVLDELAAPGEDCFFIDDLPENIEAARAVGIHAHRFVPENHAAIREAATKFFGF